MRTPIFTLLTVSTVARGQLFTLGGLEAPANRSLHTLYAFYVFSFDEAPDRPLGQPFVKFKSLVGTSRGGSMTDYKGIQLSILRYTDFWQLIDPIRFCCSAADVANKVCENPGQLLVQKPPGSKLDDVDVFTATVSFTSQPMKDVKEVLRMTGVYILVFSNCGDWADATIDGSVIVKNSYGFLPGNEYHKMPFYGWLLLIYVGLAAVWMVLSIRWWKEVFNIQNCITVVIFFGLVEALLWYTFFNDWNGSGVRGKMLFIFAILSSVVKSIFSYMLVLVASLGWGVTRPYLDRQVIMKMQVVSVLYIVLDFIREAVLSFRHSHSLSLLFVLLCLLPVSLLNGGIFYWVFIALSSLTETLRERRQFEKLALFQQLWKILILALAVATLTLLVQIFNLSRSITSRWKQQWLFSDGISHMLFLVVLAAMMYLWAPRENSGRFTYTPADAGSAGDHDDKKGDRSDVWDGGVLEEGEDEESFWETTQRDDDDDDDDDDVDVEIMGSKS
mmetsp:Transcript_82861/g.130585  ORF Transcript_82861/g.130585 Transcript_82861/m.130585 type:complete len:502 (-) Transcript_82861:111-1616(-)